MSKNKSNTQNSDEMPENVNVSGKKNRPTPKRKDAQKANITPLVPADRKEAKKIAKQKRDEFYEKQRLAMLTGDERYLPPRDKGPVRRWVRNWVDARWSWAEFVFPLILVFLFISLFVQGNRTYTTYILVILYFIFFTALVDSLIATWYLKSRLKKRFKEEEIPPRIGFYAFMRMLLLPIMRTPRPQVKKGEWPQ